MTTSLSIKKWALFSLTDKTGSETLARHFMESGVSLFASGGTKKYLEDKGLKVTDISEFTKEPERFGGRVKTLHHRVYSSLLLRMDVESDLKQWPEGDQIVAVACNFYPFQEKAKASQNFDELVEWVDIGGPTMVRAAAKNHKHVWIFTNTKQYSRFIESKDRDSQNFRQQLSLEAFELVSTLDQAIVQEWKRRLNPTANPELEYGENPHQKACYEMGSTAVQFSGRVSYNNVRDAEAAWRFVKAFDSAKHPAVSVIKHQTLCGASVAFNPEGAAQSFKWAWEGDLVSRFGGILGFNHLPSREVTEALIKPFIEVIVLPLSRETQEWAAQYRSQKERVLTVLVDPTKENTQEMWQGTIGKLTQDTDAILPSNEKYKATDKKDFWLKTSAWMGACSKSNALAITALDEKGNAVLLGAGQGQPNRIEAFSQLAWPRAQDFLKRFPELSIKKTLCFSDAFLPFPDLVEALYKASIPMLVQPGGSKNDSKVLDRAKELGIQMELTGRRHFWH